VTVDIGEELNIVILRSSLAEGPTKIIQGLNALSRLFCEELSLKSRDTAIRADAIAGGPSAKRRPQDDRVSNASLCSRKPLAYL
jgi:hypothetical protein